MSASESPEAAQQRLIPQLLSLTSPNPWKRLAWKLPASPSSIPGAAAPTPAWCPPAQLPVSGHCKELWVCTNKYIRTPHPAGQR